jgi:hypothetical protein
MIRNQHQLERWLMREIHGIEISRKPPRRSIGNRGPARNWKYRQWIRSLPCSVCGLEPCREAAHTGDHGLGSKASDYSCIPLCSDCHTFAAGSYHRLGRQEFERRHALEIHSLVGRLNRLWFHPQARMVG